jgi:hypothetical protein
LMRSMLIFFSYLIYDLKLEVPTLQAMLLSLKSK